MNRNGRSWKLFSLSFASLFLFFLSNLLSSISFCSKNMTQRLRDLIRAVRQAKTAQQERDVIAKEAAALRQAFKEQDGTYRHR
jgi:hypothetical protein